MSRFEEVVNDSIGAVVLGESTFRAETSRERIAELVRERQGARRAEVTSPPATPSTSRRRSPGSTPRRSTRSTAWPSPPSAARAASIGVTAQGMTACPCAQELVGGGARAHCSSRRFSERRSSGSSRRSRSRRTTSAASARCTSARPRTCDAGDRRAHAARDRRGLDVIGDLRADEARRRGRGRGEGPPPAALRRGLRARDDRAACVERFPDLPTTRSSRRARRTSRRSTSTTSSPSASGPSARSAASWQRRCRAAHTSRRAWLDATPERSSRPPAGRRYRGAAAQRPSRAQSPAQPEEVVEPPTATVIATVA